MIVSTNTRGICNRLKSLLGALHRDGEVKVFWQPNRFVGCKWGDLFTNKIEVKNKGPKENRHGKWRWDTTGGTPRYIDFMYGNTPIDWLSEYRRIIGTLRPVDIVRNSVELFLPKLPKTAFSVRTWKECPERRAFDFVRLIEKIEKVKGKVFITCDNGAIVTILRHKFGNKIVTHPKRDGWGNRHTVQGMQDILIDLYLAGNVHKLYVSNDSTFSELQWWFGRKLAEVEEI